MIEPSAGVDRGVLAVLNEAYQVQKLDNGTERTVLGAASASRADQSRGVAAEAQPRRHHVHGAQHQTDACNASASAACCSKTPATSAKAIAGTTRSAHRCASPSTSRRSKAIDTVTIRDRDSMAPAARPRGRAVGLREGLLQVAFGHAVSGRRISSTRRFCARPSGVSFDAIGYCGPTPCVAMRTARMPWL